VAGRIRTIKPEWLENERLAACSDTARVLSIALILVADDYGNGRAAEGYLIGQAWHSTDNLIEARDRIRRALAELVLAEFVVLYQANGQQYFHLPGWKRHQLVKHPSKPRVPAPNASDFTKSEAPPGTLLKSSGDSPEALTPDHDHDHDHDHDQEGDRDAPREVLRLEAGPGKKRGATKDMAIGAIAYLNQQLGTKYQPTSKATLKDFEEISKDGYTLEQARAVVDMKIREWRGDERMEKNLRPSTLFRPSNFRRYVTDAEGGMPAPRRDPLAPPLYDSDPYRPLGRKETAP
jgi:uncharacterized phage protein (TIGR02220 family)